MPRPIAIDVLTFPLDVAPDERERLARWLAPDERARVARLHSQRERERAQVARGRLRERLAARLGAPPEALRFALSAHGKPALAAPRGPPPHFNLSHAGGLAALALCDEVELGIDIEALVPVKEKVAERFFSAREVAALAALPAGERLAAFHRCWTRKEAVLKALGDGLTRRLDSFDVPLAARGPLAVERMEGEADPARDWALLAFEPAAGFAGALALRAAGRPVTLTHAAL